MGDSDSAMRYRPTKRQCGCDLDVKEFACQTKDKMPPRYRRIMYSAHLARNRSAAYEIPHYLRVDPPNPPFPMIKDLRPLVAKSRRASEKRHIPRNAPERIETANFENDIKRSFLFNRIAVLHTQKIFGGWVRKKGAPHVEPPTFNKIKFRVNQIFRK